MKSIKIVLIFFSVISFAYDYINLNQEGISFLEFEEYGAAMAKFEQAIALNPNLPTAYNNLGKVYVKQGNTEKALESFNKALELNPNFIPALWERGALYFGMEKWEQALTDYSKLLEIDPKSASAFHMRGKIYVKLGEFEKAIIDYNRALALDAGLTAVSQDKKRALAEIENRDGKKALAQGYYKTARGHFNEALNFDSQFAKAHNNLGLVHLHLADSSGAVHEFESKVFSAIRQFDSAILLDPSSSEFYNNRGIAYSMIETSQPKTLRPNVLADYNKALELNPQYSEALLNRGAFYFLIGETDKAMADYTQVLNLDTGLSAAYYNRGILYSKMGEYDKAMADYTQALELGGVDSAKTYNDRGNVFVLMGKFDQAVEDYNSALNAWEHAGAVSRITRIPLEGANDYYYFAGDLYKKQLRADIRRNLKKAKTLARKQAGKGLWHRIGAFCQFSFNAAKNQ